MSDYPRDLVNKDGKVKEFKRREDVPPGWFVRDTMEEVNPLPAPLAVAGKKKGGNKVIFAGNDGNLHSVDGDGTVTNLTAPEPDAE